MQLDHEWRRIHRWFSTPSFRLRSIFALASACLAAVHADTNRMDWMQVAPGGNSFVLQNSGRRFDPWGFNYDHDEAGRLIEDYWEAAWPKVEEDFREMRELGANAVRIHLQLGKFMASAEEPNTNALSRLGRLVRLAEQEGLYLDLTGLGCYHKQDVPPWYDGLTEEQRWEVQSRFWTAVARRCKDSPAIFCYDLMNEPVVPPAQGKRPDWLGSAFAGKHFVQWIALEARGRPRPEIARDWIRRLTNAIRQEDSRHLITVGLVPWSLDRPGLNSGFSPTVVGKELDFISVHLYPEKEKVAEALETLRGFAVGKPVVIEETFSLKCSVEELRAFIEGSRPVATGWIGFYWGKTLSECRQGKTIQDAIMLRWLEFFEKERRP